MFAFITANWWMFLIGALILIGAVIGVIFGVRTKGNWTDNGFMKTPSGKPIKWRADVLLSIWYRKDLSPLYVDAILATTKLINDVVGRKLFGEVIPAPETYRFDLPPPKGSGIIPVTDDNGMEPNHGLTDFAADPETGEMLRVAITLPEAALDRAYPVVLHELGGHALGLEHDESKASIMHPKLQSRPQELTDNDKELLRKTYG